MPSKRKQINVRLSDEGLARLQRLVDAMSEITGMPLSQSDVVQAGLKELERKYPPLADAGQREDAASAPTGLPDGVPVRENEKRGGKKGK